MDENVFIAIIGAVLVVSIVGLSLNLVTLLTRSSKAELNVSTEADTSASLVSLDNVDASNLQNGQALIYSAADQAFTNRDVIDAGNVVAMLPADITPLASVSVDSASGSVYANVVVMNFSMTNGTGGDLPAGTVIGTLSEDWRPSEDIFPTFAASSGNAMVITIQANGDILCNDPIVGTNFDDTVTITGNVMFVKANA